MDARACIRMLLDPDRLAVAGALARSGRSVDDVTATTGLDRRTVLTAIGELRATGLVEPAHEGYRIDPAVLREVARSVTEYELPMDPTIGFGMTVEEQTVLARHFSGRTLLDIPTSRARRQIVLQRLALEFDLGRHYTEPEVNRILAVFHPDTAALRRHLYDERLLDRAHSAGRTLYWRCGGRFIDA